MKNWNKLQEIRVKLKGFFENKPNRGEKRKPRGMKLEGERWWWRQLPRTIASSPTVSAILVISALFHSQNYPPFFYSFFLLSCLCILEFFVRSSIYVYIWRAICFLQERKAVEEILVFVRHLQAPVKARREKFYFILNFIMKNHSY